jgi:hypothetical protein
MMYAMSALAPVIWPRQSSVQCSNFQTAFSKSLIKIAHLRAAGAPVGQDEFSGSPLHPG